MTDDGRAVVAALELLRDRVTQLPLAIAQNAAQAAAHDARRRPGGSGDGEGERKKKRADDDYIGRLTRILGPLAALGTFLGQATSGFSVFTKALNLFAAAVAPVLLPVFFSLAVALAASSEVVFAKLLPALEGFNAAVVGIMIPAVLAFADALGGAMDVLDALARTGAGEAVGKINPFAALAAILPGGGALVAPLSGLMEGVPGPEATRAVDRARRDTLTELMLSMGPKASSGSVSSVWSRAQMAALSQSPFERRMLEMMSEVLRRMAAAAGATPGGTFTGGAGAGAAGLGALAAAAVRAGGR